MSNIAIAARGTYLQARETIQTASSKGGGKIIAMKPEKQKAEKYGCHNQVKHSGYWLKTRMYIGNHYRLCDQWIEDKSSRDCRYDQRGKDERCEGCRK